MDSINSLQDDIIADFELFEDWADKYEYIIDLGKNLTPLSDEHKTEDNLIHGCQSRVWLNAYQKDNKIVFEADSEAFITKGIIGLLVKVLSGHTAKEILDADLYFIEKTGLQAHLSPTRANGLASMVKQLKAYALVFGNQ